MRAACCRFPLRKLACEGLTSFSIHRSRSISSQQAGWKQKRQQAARTPASLRMPAMRNPTRHPEADEKAGLIPCLISLVQSPGLRPFGFWRNHPGKVTFIPSPQVMQMAHNSGLPTFHFEKVEEVPPTPKLRTTVLPSKSPLHWKSYSALPKGSMATPCTNWRLPPPLKTPKAPPYLVSR